MTTKKPTQKQLFTQYLRAEKAREKMHQEANRLKQMATEAGYIRSIIQHEDNLYELQTSSPHGYSAERTLQVARLGAAADFTAALGVKQ
jgi:hypothetical protein